MTEYNNMNEEEGTNTELSEIVFLGRKRERLEEKRKKEEIKEIDKEEEKAEDIYQDPMEETEEEASGGKEEEIEETKARESKSGVRRLDNPG